MSEDRIRRWVIPQRKMEFWEIVMRFAVNTEGDGCMKLRRDNQATRWLNNG